MLTAEQIELRALAREFARGELRPHAAAWDQERALPPEIFGKLAEMGFLGMRVPEEQGGLGLDLATYALVLEALAWGDASAAIAVSVHNGPVIHAVSRYGSPDQRGRWLPLLASGEAIGAFALSEDEAGSDTRHLAVRAEREGEGWRLSGTKRWVTSGERAGLLLVFARTAGEEEGDDGGEGGISAFLVPGNAPGATVTRHERMLGLAASGTVSLTFDGVRLEPEALLGSEGEGYAVAMEALIPGRVGVAAAALGIAQAALEHALDYAAERRQFDTPIWEFGGIQEKLAGMATRIASARALALDVTGRIDREEDRTGLILPSSPRSGAAIAKLVASEAAMWVTDEAVQVFGGYGYMRDYPVEKLMRDAKGMEIYHGPSELLRMLVARDTVRERLGEGR